MTKKPPTSTALTSRNSAQVYTFRYLPSGEAPPRALIRRLRWPGWCDSWLMFWQQIAVTVPLFPLELEETIWPTFLGPPTSGLVIHQSQRTKLGHKTLTREVMADASTGVLMAWRCCWCEPMGAWMSNSWVTTWSCWWFHCHYSPTLKHDGFVFIIAHHYTTAWISS